MALGQSDLGVFGLIVRSVTLPLFSTHRLSMYCVFAMSIWVAVKTWPWGVDNAWRHFVEYREVSVGTKKWYNAGYEMIADFSSRHKLPIVGWFRENQNE